MPLMAIVLHSFPVSVTSLHLYMSFSAENTFALSDPINTSMDHAVWVESIFCNTSVAYIQDVIHVGAFILKLYIAYYPVILETVTDSVNMGSHFALPVINKSCIFSTTVQWIRNVMFVNVVYVILRCRTSWFN